MHNRVEEMIERDLYNNKQKDSGNRNEELDQLEQIHKRLCDIGETLKWFKGKLINGMRTFYILLAVYLIFMIIDKLFH